MGRNHAIKRYEAHPSGQPVDLFARGIDSPVVAELLRSPWIGRASDLVAEADARGADGKRAETPVRVSWDGTARVPTAFFRGAKRYDVEAVVGHWVEERGWWSPALHVSRRSFRVIAHTGAVFDLAYDRLGDGWLLVGIAD
jgi:hypothetical protein